MTTRERVLAAIGRWPLDAIPWQMEKVVAVTEDAPAQPSQPRTRGAQRACALQAAREAVIIPRA